MPFCKPAGLSTCTRTRRYVRAKKTRCTDMHALDTLGCSEGTLHLFAVKQEHIPDSAAKLRGPLAPRAAKFAIELCTLVWA